MLTDDEIRTAWLMILGREPDNERIYAAYRHSELKTLRAALFASAEFRRRYAQGTRSAGALLMAKKAMPPAVAKPELLARMFERIQAQWTQLGDTEPYWSVVTDPRFKLERMEENRQTFFDTGDTDRQLIEAALRRNRIPQDPSRIGVELGCGVGRASIRIAPLLRELHCYDISPGNLALAERHAAEAGVTNIRFHLVRSFEQYERLEAFDFFYSRLVLQHNPPPVQRYLLQRVTAAARPGALMMFQAFTYWPGYSFDAEGYVSDDGRQHEMEMHCMTQETIFKVLAEGGCRVVEVMEDRSIGLTDGISCSFVARKR